MSHMLATFDIVFGHGVATYELRLLAITRELCKLTRNMFGDRTAPLRSISCLLDNEGCLLLQPNALPELVWTAQNSPGYHSLTLESDLSAT